MKGLGQPNVQPSQQESNPAHLRNIALKLCGSQRTSTPTPKQALVPQRWHLIHFLKAVVIRIVACQTG
jgi:hypothetical protein